MKRDWDRLRRWIVRKRLQGWSVTEICVEAQICKDTFYRWWNRFQVEVCETVRCPSTGSNRPGNTVKTG